VQPNADSLCRARSVGGECLQTGTTNLHGGWQAASSSDQLIGLEPLLLTPSGTNARPQSSDPDGSLTHAECSTE
jgi:hypothetical protein